MKMDTLKAFKNIENIDRTRIQMVILYFHIFAYPTMTIMVIVGEDFVKIYTEGFQQFLLDKTNLALSISIGVSVIIVTTSSIYLINRSFEELNFRLLQIYTSMYFGSVLFNNSIYGLKNERLIEPRSAFFSSLNIIYHYQYFLDLTALLITIEELKIQNGFSRRTTLFEIGLESLIYIDFLPCIILTFQTIGLEFRIIRELIAKQSLEDRAGLLTQELLAVSHICLVISIISYGLTRILLCFGICKKNTGALKMYSTLKIITLIFTGIFFILFSNKLRKTLGKPIDPVGKMFPIILTLNVLPVVLGIFVIDCVIQMRLDNEKSFSKNANVISANVHETKKIPRRNGGMRYLKRLERLISEFLMAENISRIFVILSEKESKLGSGQFSEVHKATLRTRFCQSVGEVDSLVAVKLISNGKTDFNNEQCLENHIQAILTEIKYFNSLGNGHDSLVKFYGITRVDGNLGIVMEYCDGGCLEKYLTVKRKSSEFPTNIQTLWTELSKLRKWSKDIASALKFLAEKNIVHGDIAARNILLDSNENVKVTDFGFSLRLYNYEQYVRSKQSIFPWRWMAPESLADLKFSQASDVWSYGVLLWEMYTFGQVPWEHLEWTSDFIASLEAGNVLEKPQFASLERYQLILQCLQFKKCRRPKLAEILSSLSSETPGTFLVQSTYCSLTTIANNSILTS